MAGGRQNRHYEPYDGLYIPLRNTHHPRKPPTSRKRKAGLEICVPSTKLVRGPDEAWKVAVNNPENGPPCYSRERPATIPTPATAVTTSGASNRSTNSTNDLLKDSGHTNGEEAEAFLDLEIPPEFQSGFQSDPATEGANHELGDDDFVSIMDVLKPIEIKPLYLPETQEGTEGAPILIADDDGNENPSNTVSSALNGFTHSQDRGSGQEAPGQNRRTPTAQRLVDGPYVTEPRSYQDVGTPGLQGQYQPIPTAQYLADGKTEPPFGYLHGQLVERPLSQYQTPGQQSGYPKYPFGYPVEHAEPAYGLAQQHCNDMKKMCNNSSDNPAGDWPMNFFMRQLSRLLDYKNNLDDCQMNFIVKELRELLVCHPRRDNSLTS